MHRAAVVYKDHGQYDDSSVFPHTTEELTVCQPFALTASNFVIEPVDKWALHMDCGEFTPLFQPLYRFSAPGVLEHYNLSMSDNTDVETFANLCV